MTMQEIFEKIKLENARSKEKYSDNLWASFTLDEMLEALQSEVDEVKRAKENVDFHGEHGMIRENLQVMNVAMRIIQEVSRRLPCD